MIASQLIAIAIYRTAIDRKITFSVIIFNLKLKSKYLEYIFNFNKFGTTLVTCMVKNIFFRLRLKMFKNVVRYIKMKKFNLQFKIIICNIF